LETTPPATGKALSPVRFFHPKLAPVKVTVKNTRSSALHTCHPHGKAIGLSFGRGNHLERPFGKDCVCGVIAAGTAREMIVQVRLGLKSTQTLELRLDYLRNARERTAFLAWLRQKRPRAALIATCRSRQGGGLFGGSRKAQLEVLVRAVRACWRWRDVEIETAKPILPAELQAALSPARLIVSHHDFRQTPRNLPGLARRLLHAGGEIAKIAGDCRSISDSVRICDLARGRRDIVAIPMGEAGLAGRILALRAASALAYAAVEQATAPGQLSLDMMKHLYRAGQITRRTRVYGVIGNPIGHSLSPLLHNTAFRARKFDAVFVPFLVRELGDFLRSIQPFGIAGFAITIPHKEGIIRYLDDCDPWPRALAPSTPLLSVAKGVSTGTIRITSGFCAASSTASDSRGVVSCYTGPEARRERLLLLWHGPGQLCVSQRGVPNAPGRWRAPSGLRSLRVMSCAGNFSMRS